MLNGGFSVQLGSSNTFARLSVDQTIEVTINKDTQTPGGTEGFSLKPGAVSRYYITAEYRSTCLRQLKMLTDTSHSLGKLHSDLYTTQIRKDESDVDRIVELLQETWTNPCDQSPSELLLLLLLLLF